MAHLSLGPLITGWVEDAQVGPPTGSKTKT